MAGRLLAAFEEYLVSDHDAPPEHPSSILRSLACLQPSRRLARAAAAWNPTADEIASVEPLLDFLRAWGRPVDASALAALAAWVEVEGLQSGLAPFTPSLYTVEVLLTALRLPYQAFVLAVPDDLAAVLALSPAGVLARAHDQLVFLGDGTAAALPPGAHVVVRVPCLTRVSAADARLFLTLGLEVMACYQADLDRQRRWVRLAPGEPLTEQFVSGIRTWHFRGHVLGELRRMDEQGAGPAVWEDGRGSLHFLHPGQAADDGMTRRRLGLWLPSLSGLPPWMDEVEPAALPLHVSPQCPETPLLDRLHRAVTTLGAIQAGSRMLEETATADLRQRLQSSERVRRGLSAAIDAGTMDRLTTFVGGDYSLEAFAPLHAALDLEGLRDFAAMALMYELCLSEETASRSFSKICKPDLARAALRDQLLELVPSGDGPTRAAACRLLATAPCAATAREREVVEDELAAHLDDAEPQVADQAALALAQSALRDVLPLPWLFRLHKRTQGTPMTAERRRRLQELAREIAAVQKRLGGLPRASKEASGTADALASLVLDVREALAAAPAPQGRIVLFSLSLIEDVVERVRRHLDAYAWEHDRDLDDLHAQMAEEGIARWITFVARAELEASRNAVDEDEEREVESFSWSRACSPTPLWVASTARINPLFVALLRRCAEVGPGGVGIGCLPLGSRIVTRLPAMLYMRIYDAGQRRFVPLVDLTRARTSGTEHQVWRLVAAAMPQTQRVEDAETGNDEETAPAEVSRERRRAPLDPDDAPPALRALAERLRMAFDLPRERLPQVLYALHDSGLEVPESEYPVAHVGMPQPPLAPLPLRTMPARPA